MSKKVLIFSTAYLPFVGGAELATKEITDRTLDYSFFLVTARLKKNLPKKEKIGRVMVYRVGFGCKFDKFFFIWLGLKKAKKLVQNNDFNLIWSIMASQASIVAAFFKKKHSQSKLLLTLQEGDEEEHLKRYVLGNNFLYQKLIRPWHLLVFKSADYIQVISNDLKKRAQKNKVACPIKVVPNAVDTAHFSQEYEKQELYKLKKRLGKGENDKYIITTSRLVKKNAVGDIIKSLPLLSANIKFLILGQGPDEESLKKICKDLKVEGRVKWLGYIEHKEMPKYLKISDIFIRPSLSEGLGNSFLEAMTAGLPVIATRIGGIPDFLFDPEVNKDKPSTGLFCKVRSPEDIARQVQRLLDNDILRERIIKNGQDLVARKYDWDIIARSMNDIFNKLLDDKGRF